MKTLFIDCGMGAAGDMLTAALLEVHPDREGFVKRFHAAGIPGVEMRAEKSVSCGITGTHVRMLVDGVEEGGDAAHGHDHHHHDHDHHDHHDHDHHHHDHHHGHNHHDHPHELSHDHAHASVQDIDRLIDRLHIDDAVRADVKTVFSSIAGAESRVHNVPVTDIHFHEVGTMDAVADVTAVCMLMKEIAPDEVIATPVATGFGTVRCAHGILPVPAPATALLLDGIPAYAGRFEGELCTPTGAALIKHFATRFEQMPLMEIQKTGYGMGSREYPRLNAVRVMLGESANPLDRVTEFFFNVDDMTGEQIGFATEKLFASGALEAYTTPVYMKKNRPGFLFSVMCRAENKDAVLRAIFRHTTTIGVRETETERHVLTREIVTTQTPDGEVRWKKTSGYGVSRRKAEYDDLARIANAREISLEEAREQAERGGGAT